MFSGYSSPHANWLWFGSLDKKWINISQEIPGKWLAGRIAIRKTWPESNDLEEKQVYNQRKGCTGIFCPLDSPKIAFTFFSETFIADGFFDNNIMLYFDFLLAVFFSCVYLHISNALNQLKFIYSSPNREVFLSGDVYGYIRNRSMSYAHIDMILYTERKCEEYTHLTVFLKNSPQWRGHMAILSELVIVSPMSSDLH